MDRSVVEQRVIALIHEQKTFEEDAIRMDTSLADVGVDSLDALNILFAIEDEYKITIPDEDARAVKTPSDIVHAIERLLAESSGDA